MPPFHENPHGRVLLDPSKRPLKNEAILDSSWRLRVPPGASAALSAKRTQAHLAEAEATDREEDALYGKDKRGHELPEGLRERRSRLARRLEEMT